MGLVLLVMWTGTWSKERVVLKLGTSGNGGAYYHFGEVLSSLVEIDSDLSVEVVETDGSVENMKLLSKGKLNAALVQNDVIFYAQGGCTDFRGSRM